ncbi:hypothetical protein L1887_10444 [Cichorium endivia]|nr:hypothetical protein L1887_10444 [Cichorium endivia]
MLVWSACRISNWGEASIYFFLFKGYIWVDWNVEFVHDRLHGKVGAILTWLGERKREKVRVTSERTR